MSNGPVPRVFLQRVRNALMGKELREFNFLQSAQMIENM